MAPAAAFVALAAVALAFFVSWPHRDAPRLPYTAVQYSATDAKRAFASEDLSLVVGSHSPGVTDLHDARLVVEVTVFGNPELVRRTGFQDLTHARDCKVGGHLALHWRGNVRAIVNCDLVRPDGRWIARVDRALANLQ
jgi:hypothetical protein